jgi:hypothetical protein
MLVALTECIGINIDIQGWDMGNKNTTNNNQDQDQVIYVHISTILAN